jgi:tetratricopeptide (TPR) repeat protein
VRGVVWQLTDAKDQRAVYTALEAHFEPMATPEWEKVETLADLTPAIERYHTLVGLGRYDDAFILFNDRLNQATHYRLAANRERIAWLERLFSKGMADLPALTSDSTQSLALNSLAMSYQFSGQPARAVPLFQRAGEIHKRLGSLKNRQICLSNLGHALRETGALREAVGTLQQALVLIHELEDRFWEGVSLEHLGHVLCSMSDNAIGHVALSRGQHLCTKQGYPQLEGVISTYLAERSLWIGGLAEAGAWADRAWELAGYQRNERDFMHAAVLQGQIALRLGDLARADERLHHSLTRARAANLVELELPALIAIAELELQRRHWAEAKTRLDDVWEGAERGPYPICQADAFNVLAAIARAEGDKPAAISAATKAFKAAWCDGPPYAYHWGLEAAKAHLVALDAPEPEMPPFDESKFKPLPEVEINPKDEFWVDPDTLDD